MCLYLMSFDMNTVITQLNVDCLTVNAFRCVEVVSELASQFNAVMGFSQ